MTSASEDRCAKLPDDLQSFAGGVVSQRVENVDGTLWAMVKDQHWFFAAIDTIACDP
ncbi:hypothetical protein [Mesorhizobium sp. LjRoot246]|uniref:hypothetical protein n=1 Tax=Mesorhizobium sp. LjRoot246 TaxID=3342294 RepID=UPI003ECD9BE3